MGPPPCLECGEVHAKKSDICKVGSKLVTSMRDNRFLSFQVREMKVKVLVQQIMKGSENIKENMDHVWR